MQLLHFPNQFVGKSLTQSKKSFSFNRSSLARKLQPLKIVASTYGENPVTAPSNYITLGLAHCFERNDDGKLDDKFVIEPIGAAAIECMANGAKTSYKAVTAVKVGDALEKNRDLLPNQFSDGRFCDGFQERCEAATRTWLRPHAQDYLMDLVPLGTVRSNFNFNTDDKRVLNFQNVVDDDDNIKQDMSIDVYGRNKEESESAQTDNQNESQPQQQTTTASTTSGGDDDLDALLDM